MIIESLKVNNFRVFKGEHLFDLAPKSTNGQRPIVLFGGLNGAGKTTMLTAVRLSLYGRQSLGSATTTKAYQQFLSDCIHVSKASGLQSNSASVELYFSHANLGIISHYHIIRSWTAVGNKVTESLKIYDADKEIKNLTYDQAQGFLNELIPIGVSDLFFFDGEKIGELASKKDDTALGDSVKKLIGLDLIDKLTGDLTVFIRNQNKLQASPDINKKIKQLESALAQKEAEIEREQTEYEALKIRITGSTKHIEQLTNNLNLQGGAWAATREQEIKNLALLKEQKNKLESKLRDALSSSYPFSIAPKFAKRCLTQLDDESKVKNNNNIVSALTKYSKSFEQRLSSSVDEASLEAIMSDLQHEFEDYFLPVTSKPLIHDVSSTLQAKISSAIKESLTHQKDVALTLTSELDIINQQIDSAGINISRAPEESILAQRLLELNNEQNSKTELAIRAEKQKDILKALLQGAMDLVRSIDKLHARFLDNDSGNRALEYAHKSLDALSVFSRRTAISKINKIEKEFTLSYQRLSRKEDTHIMPKIDPQSFDVKLFDDFGNEIQKKSLSSGERQIYAMSILDALAKTSGRKLPIIIDTPLGRLDSKHREKLISSYFPLASHQVILLSTDTEVGKEYFSSLSKHISHTITLGYDGKTTSSSAAEGYFWSQEKEVTLHAP